MAYLLSRNSRYEDDLEDQLTNSTEKRVARALLLLAHFGGTAELLKTVPYESPEMLAHLVGTTRARVSQVMSSFRKAGLIDYNRREITVRPALLKVLFNEHF
jgi:CRP/FNR family cyclic AMP-dependent transcriptional regulator